MMARQQTVSCIIESDTIKAFSEAIETRLRRKMRGPCFSIDRAVGKQTI